MLDGGDLNGFFLIRGESAKLDSLLSSPEWETHMMRAALHLQGSGQCVVSLARWSRSGWSSGPSPSRHRRRTSKSATAAAGPMKISIILPLFDRRNAGWRALESALHQRAPESCTRWWP